MYFIIYGGHFGKSIINFTLNSYEIQNLFKKPVGPNSRLVKYWNGE